MSETENKLCRRCDKPDDGGFVDGYCKECVDEYNRMMQEAAAKKVWDRISQPIIDAYDD